MMSAGLSALGDDDCSWQGVGVHLGIPLDGRCWDLVKDLLMMSE